MQWEEQF